MDPGISLKVKDGYLHKYKPKIAPLLKLNRNDHPLKVDDLPEALCYLIDRGANGNEYVEDSGGKYVEDSKASMYAQFSKDAEETHKEECSTLWGDISL